MEQGQKISNGVKKISKIITILVSVSLILQSLGPGILFPIKTAHAGTLSASMFPSTLEGLPLLQTSATQEGSCYTQSEEFVGAAYFKETTTVATQLGVSLMKFNSSSVAKSQARECITLTKGMFAEADWGQTKDLTVSGYDSISVMAEAPAEGIYIGVIYTFVQSYVVVVVMISTKSVSESTLKSASTTMLSKLPVEAEEGKDDGELCNDSQECESRRCYNNICCSSGECCQGDEHCYLENQYCDLDNYYCVPKKSNSESCKSDNECHSEFCYQGKCDDKPAGEKLENSQLCTRDVDCESGICERGPNSSGKKYCCAWGQECCQSHSDCQFGYIKQYCNTEYGQCIDLKDLERRCPGDYACKSGYCKNGWCKIKQEKPIGQRCLENDECQSGYCGNGICCQTGEYCCQSDNDCGNVLGDWWECKSNRCWENIEGRKAFARGRDGECEYTEPCDTLDCMASGRCTIEEVCEWGGPGMRTAVGCIATIAADLNIIAKVADILQSVGCDIIVNFVAGLLEQNVEKATSALVNIVYTAIDVVKLKVGTVIKFVFNIFVCIDNYFGFSTWFLWELIPAAMGVINSVAQEAGAAVGLGSPASLMVTNEKGQQTGVDEQGNLHNDIPGSFYVEFPNADIKLVVLPDTKNKDFSVETKGEKQGQIDLMITRTNTEGEIENIEYNDVSQQKGTKTELSFNSEMGADVEGMEVTGVDGKKRVKEADEVTKDKIEVSKEYQVGGLWKKVGNFFTSKLFMLIIAIIVLTAAAYVALKKFGKSKKTWIIIGVVALIIALVLIFLVFKVFEKKEGKGKLGEGPPVTSEQEEEQKPSGVNFETYEFDLSEITDIQEKFHVEYPDWPITQGKLVGEYAIFSVGKNDEAWIEISTEGGEGDTIEEAWQGLENSVKSEEFEGVNIIKMELDKANRVGIAEFDDPLGKLIKDIPAHIFLKDVFVEVEGEGFGGFIVVAYVRRDKWSEYEDAIRYSLSTAKIIKDSSDIEVSDEVKEFQESKLVKARDSRRLSDISQIRTALEMYYADLGGYPLGDKIAIGGKCFQIDSRRTYAKFLDECWDEGTILMAQVPSNPSPRTDGDCPDRDYIYEYSYDPVKDVQSYTIKYCLGVGTSTISAGEHQATPEGLAKP